MNFCDTCGQSMGVRSTVRVCAVCETTERLEAEHAESIERLKIRVWNSVLNVCGGVGTGEKAADYVIEHAFDESEARP